MAQFTKYSSSDASAPVLSGTAGSLIAVLDAVLINGYGSKAAAGWTQPLTTAGNIACYKQGSGSLADCTLLVNDNSPGVGGAREARLTGWRTLTTLTGVGVGSGQFPIPAQSLTTGFVAARKSSSADATARGWVVYADSRTFYMFVNSEGTAARTDFGFGEFFSLWGSSDVNNAFITGRLAENSATVSVALGGLDKLTRPSMASAFEGTWMVDNYAGNRGSALMFCGGDESKMAAFITSNSGQPAHGSLPTPNTSDGAYYLAPLNVLESSWALRGRRRGLYHICHPLASVADGTSISGTGDFSGKTFEVVNPAGSGGMLAIDVSNTLDTN